MLQCIDLTGWWQIKFDARDEGTQLGWAQQPPADSAPINVPSCWNNVFPDHHTYNETAWYFTIPSPIQYAGAGAGLG
jgi:beta-galactosidase/beta-glucuronidase